MVLPQYHVPVLDVDATREAEFFRILIPLIQNIQLLGSGIFQVIHPLHHLNHTSATGTVKAPCFHLDSSLLPRLQQEFSRFNLGRDICR